MSFNYQYKCITCLYYEPNSKYQCSNFSDLVNKYYLKGSVCINDIPKKRIIPLPFFPFALSSKAMDLIEYVGKNTGLPYETIIGLYKYYDIYKGYSQNGISNVSNVFGLVSDLLKTTGAGPKDGYYGCVLTNYDSRSAHRDEHMIDAYHKQGLSRVTTHNNAGLIFTDTPED